jgi:hypothetical protein
LIGRDATQEELKAVDEELTSQILSSLYRKKVRAGVVRRKTSRPVVRPLEPEFSRENIPPNCENEPSRLDPNFGELHL